LQTAVATYSSPVHYPVAGDNPAPAAQVIQFAAALKMVAQIVTTIPEANLLYVQLGGFDHHSQEIGTNADGFTNKTLGIHATLLKALSLGIQVFYDDMAAHGLADNVVMMTFTEFGRRPNENASKGTDHGTITPIFVVGNAVKGGKLYGEQPSLTDLDSAGNMKYKVDFRSVYAEMIDKWLGGDSQSVLGANYPSLGLMA